MGIPIEIRRGAASRRYRGNQKQVPGVKEYGITMRDRHLGG